MVGARYRAAAACDKSTILDEFVAIIGYLRKHAMRVLGASAGSEPDRRVLNRLYDEAVREALVLL